jgi:homoserine kinase type II
VYDELLDAWALPRPRVLTRAHRGYSNETWFVRSAAGDHVLRLHTNKHVEAIRFEHALLRQVATAELTFRTPKPIETEGGDTLATETSSARAAALFRRIPGRHLDENDQDGAAMAAAAYAALDVALAGLDRIDVATPVFSGDLRAVHPAITDLAELEGIAGPAARELAEAAAANAPAIYTSLPIQLIHGDFGLGNVLVRAGRVRGLLDFEHAGRNVRALELGGALRTVLTMNERERLWRPVLGGYLRTLALDPAEIAALPGLVLLQSAIVLVWAAGRTVAGSGTPEALSEYVERARGLSAWIAANGTRLVAYGMRASE